MPPWGGYLCTLEDLGGAGFAGGRRILLKPGLFPSSTSALSELVYLGSLLLPVDQTPWLTLFSLAPW